MQISLFINTKLNFLFFVYLLVYLLTCVFMCIYVEYSSSIKFVYTIVVAMLT